MNLLISRISRTRGNPASNNKFTDPLNLIYYNMTVYKPHDKSYCLTSRFENFMYHADLPHNLQKYFLITIFPVNFKYFRLQVLQDIS